MRKEITKSGTPYWTCKSEKSQGDIILIHGYRGTHHGLELIAKNLKQLNVIVPDIPGFGEGEALQDYSINNYANWLKKFIAELNLNKIPYLLGHSFGSVIVSSYVAANPNQIKKLILLNPIPSPVAEAKNLVDYFGDMYYGLGRYLPTKLSSKWFSSKYMTIIASEFMIKNRDKTNRKTINKAHLDHFSDYHSVKSLVDSYKTSSVHSVKEFAPKITTETLIIAGDKDDIAPLKNQFKLEEIFTNAKLEVIHGVGHLTHYETPKEVAKIIEDYLELTSSE